MKLLVYLAAGAFIGLVAFAGTKFGVGILVGMALAFLVYELKGLTARVAALERDRKASTDDAPSHSQATEESAEVRDTPSHTQSSEEPTEVSGLSFDEDPSAETDAVQPEGYRARPALAPSKPATDIQRAPNPIVEKGREWLTTGNVPVKIGVIVSFFGVAFLLKYAVEQNLLNVPMSLRMAFAALFGLALLIVGWRLRKRMRVYALSLQGGGVGIIYLTIFAAMRLYGLLSPVVAFVLLVLLTVPAATLAVVQNARAMAVLAVTGGFLAPVLTSTGEGSHVALFSYYLLLNLAIVGIAWFKSWRELNLAGFLFTFIIGTYWGYRYYRPELLASTEPFLVAHFLLYQVAAILFALRQPPKLRGIVDGTLIFGTPIVAFGIQAALLADTEYGLAYSAVVLAVFYGVVAWWLSRRDQALRLLRDAYLALALAFATVAVPLFLDASWTAATWAMEGAALIWLSVRQHALLPRFAGVALILLAGGSYIVGNSRADTDVAVFNGSVLGGVLLSLAGFFSARSLGRVDHSLSRLTAFGLFAWGMAWWLLTGWFEIEDQLRHSQEYPVRVAFLALSGMALAIFGRLLDWRMAKLGALAMLPLLMLYVFDRSIDGTHPFESNATVSWLLVFAVHLYVLRGIAARSWQATTWHIGGVLLVAWLLAREIDWWVVVETWRNASISLTLTALAIVCLWGGRFVHWPLQAERAAYITSAAILLGLNLLFITLFSIASPGDPLPYSYLPLLNPYDLTTVAALLVAYFGITSTTTGDNLRRVRTKLSWLLAGFAFVLSTSAIVRGVYHYSDISWRQYALTQSVEVQAALSIYWGLLGFAAMVLGARRAWRWLWLTGSGLMALVVLKLFLVDLGNSGTVARIVSFIGVGALLLVVGYFAPAPPRADHETR